MQASYVQPYADGEMLVDTVDSMACVGSHAQAAQLFENSKFILLLIIIFTYQRRWSCIGTYIDQSGRNQWTCTRLC